MTLEEFEESFNAALKLKDEGEFEQAVALLSSLMGSGFHKATVMRTISGIIYYEMHDADRALPLLRESVALSPNSELSSLGLFHALIHVGRDDEAFDEARRYLKNNRSDEYMRLFREMRGIE
jgi:predicted Zn-dependent protease